MLKSKSSQSSGCTHAFTIEEEILKKTWYARKLMETVFCDKKELLILEITQKWTTIKSEVYCFQIN
jgi:hypothetical protein